MKILHSEASTGWGGQEIRILEEMNWFRSRGHEVMLIGPPHAILVKRAEEEGFETAYLFFTKNRIGREIFKFSAIIKGFTPDVVATHSSVDSWVGLISAKYRRIEKRVRYRHVCTPVKGHLLNRWQYRRLATLILTTGQCIRKPLIETFSLPPEKVVSTPTAISPPAEMPNREAARKSLQAELGIDSSVRFVGQVSVLRRLKGHRTLIEAFDRIASSFPSLHLVLVGAGPVEQDIKKAVLDSPHKKRIHLLGHKEDPWPFFRAFEVSVLASLSDEGIPQSLTRSMYAQTPVVGTDVGGITEVVLNGSTGLTAIPGDSTSLGAVLKSLLEDKALQERLSEKARDLVTERFRWDALGQKIEDLFRG